MTNAPSNTFPAQLAQLFFFELSDFLPSQYEYVIPGSKQDEVYFESSPKQVVKSQTTGRQTNTGLDR